MKRYFFLLVILLITVLIKKECVLTIGYKEKEPIKTTTIENTLLKNQGVVLVSNKNPTKKTHTKKELEQLAYVKRFAKTAIGEMHKYKIPASITLAQGLLESNAGSSPLASKNNNHFGIKCFSKNCKTNHCSNFTDDSHKDFFINYQTAWESYRAHSLFLQKDRYKHLSKLSSKDYVQWAKGLKKAGYATDPNYADKLIELIENLNLTIYDGQ